MLIAQGTLGSIGVTAVAARRATGRGEIYTLREAQIMIESWRRHDNRVRPHGSLGYRPPAPEVFVLAFGPGRLRHPDRLCRPGTP